MLPSPPGEDDEGDVGKSSLCRPEEVNPIHLRHLVIRHDDIELTCLQDLKGFTGAQCCGDRHITSLLEENLRHIKEGYFVIDQENLNQNKSLQRPRVSSLLDLLKDKNNRLSGTGPHYLIMIWTAVGYLRRRAKTSALPTQALPFSIRLSVERSPSSCNAASATSSVSMQLSETSISK